MTAGEMAAGRNDSFRRYLEEAIGQRNASVALSALDEPASVSVRLNPWKTRPEFAEAEGGVPWSEYGLFLGSRPVFTLDHFFHGGAYYVQDSSSMFVGHVLRQLLQDMPAKKGRPLRILDLCAAPGGKTTDLAASLRKVCGSGFLLVSNEVVSQRASVLASNAAVWGDPCVVVTSDDPSRFASLRGWFDIIVADVPCSGEGMFRKDALAREQWSEDNVRLCQGRQRRIIGDVWPALAEGGILVYSTCTFNRYENDDNVRWISDNLGAGIISESADDSQSGVLRTECGFSLVPGFVKGEGQYCAALMKTSSEDSVPLKRVERPRFEIVKGKAASEIGLYFTESVAVLRREGFVKALPEAVAEEMLALEGVLHVLSSGCAAGEMKRDTLVPDPDLALSLIFRKDAFPQVRLDPEQSLAYLQGNPPVLRDMPSGFLTVCCGALPLGFVKNLGARCNSLYPKSRRIRMDIKINR